MSYSPIRKEQVTPVVLDREEHAEYEGEVDEDDDANDE